MLQQPGALIGFLVFAVLVFGLARELVLVDCILSHHRLPHEVRNLAENPAHFETLRRLRALVDQLVVESGDRGGINEDPLDIYRGYNVQLPDQPGPRKGSSND